MPLTNGTFLGVEVTPSRVLLGLLVACLSYIFLKIAKFSTSPLARIRTVPGLPLLGEVKGIFGVKDLISFQLKSIKAAGEDGLVRLVRLQGLIVSVCKPDYIKYILVTNNKNYMKPDFIKRLMPNVSGGLFSAHGSDHAWQRKLMNPMFSHSSVKCYVESFERHCTDLLKLWTEKCKMTTSGEAAIRIGHHITSLTLDIIGDTAFGYDFNSLVTGGTKTSRAFSNILEGKFSVQGLLFTLIIPFYKYIPTESNKEARKAMSIAARLVEEVVNKRRQQETKESQSSSNDRDLLSVLMKACAEDSEKKMTDALLVSNVWTFMVAGYETTSTGLTWTLYHLARNPEIQEKARKEATEVLTEGQNVQPEDVEKLLYITAVIKESLRRTPPAALIFRQSLDDDKLGDFVIPKGTILSIPIAGMHHCEKFWAEPFKFVPERFLESDETWSSGIQGQTYFPFSHGPRSCIGSKFALMEMKVILARLLTTFRFSVDPRHPEVGSKLSLTLKPLPPPMLQVTLLQKEGSSEADTTL